jgi:hypothetical protein
MFSGFREVEIDNMIVNNVTFLKNSWRILSRRETLYVINVLRVNSLGCLLYISQKGSMRLPRLPWCWYEDKDEDYDDDDHHHHDEDENADTDEDKKEM